MQKVDYFIGSFQNPAFPLYVYGLGTTCFFMIYVWFVYLLIKNPAIVDVYWSMGLIILASVFFLQRPVGGAGSWQAKAFFAAIILWGCRLGIYLLVRMVVYGKIDSRYAYLQKNWGNGFKRHWNCLQQYYFQAFLQSVLAIAFLGLYSNENYYGKFYYLGLVLSVFGIAFSSLADRQLANFVLQKKSGSADGKVMNKGLWAFSRHPNYFFEWLVWLGFAFMSVESFAGVWVLLAPFTVYGIFVFLTIPLSEKVSRASRGKEYAAYCQSTNMFFPGVKKR